MPEQHVSKVIKCPVCGRLGSVQIKSIPVKGRVYHYLYVAHYDGLHGQTRKVRWHYIGKKRPDRAKLSSPE
ncbi:MAG: hypothetical protein QXG05_03230 [Nitrososphaerota archaeon]